MDESIQPQISRELEFTWYNTRSKISREAYAIKIMSNGRDLITPHSNSEFVNKLSGHFTEDIKTAISVREIRDFEDLIKLFEIFYLSQPVNFENYRDD